MKPFHQTHQNGHGFEGVKGEAVSCRPMLESFRPSPKASTVFKFPPGRSVTSLAACLLAFL